MASETLSRLEIQTQMLFNFEAVRLIIEAFMEVAA